MIALQVDDFVMMARSMEDKTHRFASIISEWKLLFPFWLKSSIFMFILSLFAMLFISIFLLNFSISNTKAPQWLLWNWNKHRLQSNEKRHCQPRGLTAETCLKFVELLRIPGLRWVSFRYYTPMTHWDVPLSNFESLSFTAISFFCRYSPTPDDANRYELVASLRHHTFHFLFCKIIRFVPSYVWTTYKSNTYPAR